MPSRWTDWVKEWASENKMSYGCALSKPQCSLEYRREYDLPLKEKHRAYAMEEEKRQSNKEREQQRRNKLREAGVNRLKQLKEK